jgi:hypothetical protein
VNVFHITVGASPNGSVDLRPEIRLLKAALLYADKVKFCSISSVFILSLIQSFGDIGEDDLWSLLLELDQFRSLKPIVDRYQILRSKKLLQGAEIHEFDQLRLQLNKIFEVSKPLFQEYVHKLAIDAGADGLISAIDSKLVEIQNFHNTNIKEWVAEFFDVVGNAVLAKETYPLFDGGTGELINFAFREGKLNPSTLSKSKSKQAGLSSDLLRRLPLFDQASIDEIMDIRRELDKPLVNFRAAIMKFSEEIENESWKEEFPQESEQVFRKYVEPSILEIEDIYNSNNTLMKFALGLSKVGVPSTLGVLLAQATNLPQITALALGLGVGGTTIAALETRKEWLEKKHQIEQHQLYFYYRTGEMLTKGR